MASKSSTRKSPARPTPPLSRVFQWFAERRGTPTAPQAKAWPLIQAGKNVLIASPTGTGKTFAAFLSVLDALVRDHEAGKLQNTIHCVYVSPLRALSYDLEKNLAEPLSELFGNDSPIRVELRTGDTKASQRQQQFRRPPHILLTTPESLCVLLSQPKWLTLLSSVRWVIVDEIHALAENKRGAHLALSIERLAGVTTNPPQRIGLSATIAPLPRVAQYLVGTHGDCEIVDTAENKRIELQVYTPLRKDPYPEAGYTGERLVRELGHLIQKHRTTLVFSNTRSGAEGVTYWLRLHFPELAPVIECHHASLDRDERRMVEDRLKRGELRAVVCSTSLEMGIDIGSVDLVVMMSTPKGVAKALQRAGRAGHNIHSVSRGILMATNLSDLVESCATVLLARRRHLDETRIPDAPLDVLAQHLVSMGCTGRWTKSEALELIQRAYPYRDFPADELDNVLDYLAGGGASLRAQYTETFGKIVLDEDGFETREGRVRREFLQNIGVIPSVGTVQVRLHSRVLGSVEEFFMRGMKPGDIFALGGRSLRLEKLTQMTAWVERADGETPTVPRWNANKMPLSNRVCEEIVRFRSELCERMREETETMPAWIADRLDCGKANAELIWRMHKVQDTISEIPTEDFLLVEELKADAEREDPGRESRRKKAKAPRSPQHARHYFFHTLLGRAANDALARGVAARINKLRGGNAVATPHDYGFVLTVTEAQRFTAEELPTILDPAGFETAIQEGLGQSDMLQYHFRNAAQTGLMVYRNYFGEQKSARKLAWSAEVIFNVLQRHEPDHVLMREARRDTLATFLDIDSAMAFLQAQKQKPIRLRAVEKVPPLAFAMYMTKIKEALLIEDPFELQERLFHQWWEELEQQ